MIIDNQMISAEPSPLFHGDRVFVPLRLVAQALGAEVNWHEESNTVEMTRGSTLAGAEYLKGESNFISATELKSLLDDDNDDDIADYRTGHNGGDLFSNDPLVVDIRAKEDYAATHIPGAVWIAGAHDIADQANLTALGKIYQQHIDAGGKAEIVLYCFTGNSSGLAAGVLGTQGLPVRSMMYGFDIAWRGTKYVEKAVRAPMEDDGGKTIECST